MPTLTALAQAFLQNNCPIALSLNLLPHDYSYGSLICLQLGPETFFADQIFRKTESAEFCCLMKVRWFHSAKNDGTETES